jgi:hypothetical protein
MPLFCFLFVNPKLLHRAMRSVSSSGNCRLDSIDRGPFQWYNAANFAAVKLLILFICWLMRSSPPLGTNAATDALPERDASGGKANFEMDRVACIDHGGFSNSCRRAPSAASIWSSPD